MDASESKSLVIQLTDSLVINADGSITISMTDAETVAYAVRRRNCMDDIVDYFKSDESEYDQSVLENDVVMDSILEDYVDYRENADGGCPEYCMPWDKCLQRALEDNEENGLEKYRLDRRDTKQFSIFDPINKD